MPEEEREVILKGGFKELEELKEIPIEWEGNKDVIVIKKLNAGDMQQIRKQSREFKVVGNNVIPKLDMDNYQLLTLFKGIAKAPFKIAIEDILRLPVSFWDGLFVEIQKFNNLSEEKKAD
jgi:hypothetical protein